MIIWLIIAALDTLSYWLIVPIIQSGGVSQTVPLPTVADYPFYGNGPYVWPPLWFGRQSQSGSDLRPYWWPSPNQMGLPVRWMGSRALPLPVPDVK